MVAAILAGVLVVAVGSGLFGGWVATQLDDGSTAQLGDGGAGATTELDRSSLAGTVSQVQPSVVSVKTDAGGGSGVVLDTQGHVLTNNHVVAAASGDTVAVTLSNGDSHEATIVGTDPRSDLAVLNVDDVPGLTPAEFGDSDAVEVGDSVLALGSPLGLEGSVTSGIVSAENRTIQVGDRAPGQASQLGVTSISGMLQTDAPINPGNSGGALVNLGGEVIGINSAIATAGGGNGNIGVGFAIPANTATLVAKQLVAGEAVEHPYLGVSVGDAGGEGALVQAVAPDGPAGEAGLRPGDVVTEAGGQAVRSADELVAAVQQSQVGDQLELTYVRDGGEQQATVTVGEAPAT